MKYYQITLGGSDKENSKIGEIIGPSFSSDEIINALQKITDVYLEHRTKREDTFLKTLSIIGIEPFKRALYGNNKK